MKKLIPTILFILISSILTGQNTSGLREGKVSYVTSQNVYVKFESTGNIVPGDTLFSDSGGSLIPVLTVKDISSISCICIPIGLQKLSVGETVLSNRKQDQETKASEADVKVVLPVTTTRDTMVVAGTPVEKRKQVITGNVSVASYLNFSNSAANSQRMKYNFALTIQNIGNTKFSLETYMTFAHKYGEWSTIQDDIFNGLKVYSLAVNYDINKHHRVLLGRKINPRISNAGAIDGLQYEFKAGRFVLGAIAGSRPDYKNYSINPNLFQFGGYLGYDYNGKHGSTQTTVAFIDQLNNGFTDRRFTYLQHTNSLIRNLYFFGSVEVDLYKKTMNQVDTAVSRDTSYTTDNSPTLSNLYLSLRYRPVKKLSLSVSYSARQNVIYYETYKDIVDRLLEAATVNGFMFQINYQPIKLLSIGIHAGYRDSKKDPRPSKNLYGYLTFTRIPGINAMTTISATILETSYLSGQIYSLGLNRELLPNRLSAGISYRYVHYRFISDDSILAQNMGEVNFTWRIMKKLSCGIYYEGTFDKNSTFNRLYINITQRF